MAMTLWSLPTRECGLKFVAYDKASSDALVAPHAGVWIEITPSLVAVKKSPVAPHAGVWIEIYMLTRLSLANWSLPTRECGLKFQMDYAYVMIWMSLPTRECGLKFCRSVRQI